MGEKRFKVGDEFFSIPEHEIEGFLETFPDAQEVKEYQVGEEIFNIPLEEEEGFLETFDDAKLVQATPRQDKEEKPQEREEPPQPETSDEIPTITVPDEELEEDQESAFIRGAKRYGKIVGDFAKNLGLGLVTTVGGGLNQLPLLAAQTFVETPRQYLAKKRLDRALLKGELSDEEYNQALKDLQLESLERIDRLAATTPSIISGVIPQPTSLVDMELDEAASFLENTIQQFEGTYEETLRKGDPVEITHRTLNALAQSIPLSLFVIGTGPASLPIIGGMTAATRAEELRERSKQTLEEDGEITPFDLSLGMQTVNSTLHGAAEMAGEAYMAGVGNWIRKGIVKRGKREMLDKGSDFLGSVLGRIYRRVGLGGVALGEGISELSTQVMQNGVSAATGEDPDRNLFEGGAESFIVGTLSGLLLGGGGTYVARRANARSLSDSVTGVVDKAEQGNLQEAVLSENKDFFDAHIDAAVERVEISAEDGQKIKDGYATVLSIANSIPKNKRNKETFKLVKNKKRLLNEIAAKEKELAQTDEVFQPEVQKGIDEKKDEINGINAQLAEYSDRAREPIVGTVDGKGINLGEFRNNDDALIDIDGNRIPATFVKDTGNPEGIFVTKDHGQRMSPNDVAEQQGTVFNESALKEKGEEIPAITPSPVVEEEPKPKEKKAPAKKAPKATPTRKAKRTRGKKKSTPPPVQETVPETQEGPAPVQVLEETPPTPAKKEPAPKITTEPTPVTTEPQAVTTEPSIQVKDETVDFMFEENPDMTEIGTKDQYKEYLKTIPPVEGDVIVNIPSGKQSVRKKDYSLGSDTDAKGFQDFVKKTPKAPLPKVKEVKPTEKKVEKEPTSTKKTRKPAPEKPAPTPKKEESPKNDKEGIMDLVKGILPAVSLEVVEESLNEDMSEFSRTVSAVTETALRRRKISEDDANKIYAHLSAIGEKALEEASKRIKKLADEERKAREAKQTKKEEPSAPKKPTERKPRKFTPKEPTPGKSTVNRTLRDGTLKPHTFNDQGVWVDSETGRKAPKGIQQSLTDQFKEDQVKAREAKQKKGKEVISRRKKKITPPPKKKPNVEKEYFSVMKEVAPGIELAGRQNFSASDDITTSRYKETVKVAKQDPSPDPKYPNYHEYVMAIAKGDLQLEKVEEIEEAIKEEKPAPKKKKPDEKEKTRVPSEEKITPYFDTEKGQRDFQKAVAPYANPEMEEVLKNKELNLVEKQIELEALTKITPPPFDEISTKDMGKHKNLFFYLDDKINEKLSPKDKARPKKQPAQSEETDVDRAKKVLNNASPLVKEGEEFRASTIDAIATYFLPEPKGKQAIQVYEGRTKNYKQAEATYEMWEQIGNRFAEIYPERFRNGEDYIRQRVQRIGQLTEVVDVTKYVGKDNIKFQIIGPEGAQNNGLIKSRLRAAVRLEAEGWDPARIFAHTYWQVDSSGRWKYDLINKASMITPYEGRTYSLPEVLHYRGDGPSPYDLYPQLKDIKVQLHKFPRKRRKKKDAAGRFVPNPGRYVNGPFSDMEKPHFIILNQYSDTTKEGMLQNLIHETQHAIQLFEGTIQSASSVDFQRTANAILNNNLDKFNDLFKEQQNLFYTGARLHMWGNPKTGKRYMDDAKELSEKIDELTSDLDYDEATLKKRDELAYALYHNTHNEVEARNAAYRTTMMLEHERRRTPITETEFAPAQTQILVSELFSDTPAAIYSLEGVNPSEVSEREAMDEVADKVVNDIIAFYEDFLKKSDISPRDRLRVEDAIKRHRATLKDPKFQKVGSTFRGAAVEQARGEFILFAMDKPDVSTALHEFGHVFESDLESDQRNFIISEYTKNLRQETGANASRPDGYTRDVSEWFIKSFEKWTGMGTKAQTSHPLADVFNMFKEWLAGVYNGVVKFTTSNNLTFEVHVSSQMEEFFDNLILEKKKLSPAEKTKARKLIKAYSDGTYASTGIRMDPLAAMRRTASDFRMPFREFVSEVNFPTKYKLPDDTRFEQRGGLVHFIPTKIEADGLAPEHDLITYYDASATYNKDTGSYILSPEVNLEAMNDGLRKQEGFAERINKAKKCK